LNARVARVLREPHPWIAAAPAEYPTKVLGMVLVKQSGLVMKLRGMILELRPEVPRLNPFYFFRDSSAFFSFHLTGVGVFCNHHRLPAG
jgi:hypothetical protein